MIKHIKNLPLGIFIGAGAGLALAFAIDGDMSEAAARNWTFLFSALVSLLAAAIALVGVSSNIENQDKVAQANRAGDLKAAKAVLPLALTNLTGVAKKCADFAMEEEAFYRDPVAQQRIRAAIALDPAVLTTIKDCIRSSDTISGEWLAAIIRKYQICFSRHNAALSDAHLINILSRAELAMDWALLWAMADHCWEFARGSVQVPKRLDPSKLRMPFDSQFLGHQVYSEAADKLGRRLAQMTSGKASDFDD